MTLATALTDRRNWTVAPAALAVDADALTVEAHAGTDVFTNPLTGEVRDDAARALLAPPPGDWQFSARLRVGFGAPWDAGGLLLWSAPDVWAKLTFEQSPDGRPAVYSVVTRGLSDDAVGQPLDPESAWLRISRVDDGFAFHSSSDGRSWRLARQFGLGTAPDPRVGLTVQSPVGDGCVVAFDRVTLTPTRQADLFDGS
ncbi:DUF1349 domain-containing protein [Streptomyces sp. NPDC059491]|uniref:DUF1349 domain-containing protein n=1 Tax=Streptomyces sp. NPDC059491 TaxID=3346850 RepID=UPI0036A2B608